VTRLEQGSFEWASGWNSNCLCIGFGVRNEMNFVDHASSMW